jgi:hypothetical protein
MSGCAHDVATDRAGGAAELLGDHPLGQVLPIREVDDVTLADAALGDRVTHFEMQLRRWYR